MSPNIQVHVPTPPPPRRRRSPSRRVVRSRAPSGSAWSTTGSRACQGAAPDGGGRDRRAGCASDRSSCWASPRRPARPPRRRRPTAGRVDSWWPASATAAPARPARSTTRCSWMETAGAPSTVLVTDVFVFTVARFSKVLGGPGCHHLALPHPVATKSAGPRRRPGSGGGARGVRPSDDARRAAPPGPLAPTGCATVPASRRQASDGFADRGLDGAERWPRWPTGPGWATQTVFRHFPTKADLLDGVATHWLKDWADGLQRRMRGDAPRRAGGPAARAFRAPPHRPLHPRCPARGHAPPGG